MREIKIIVSENFAVDEADEFREKLNQLISKGEKNFMLDFSNCSFIDSTGLGVLVSIYKKCMELNGSVKFHGINNEQVRRVFKLTRLDKVFDI